MKRQVRTFLDAVKRWAESNPEVIGLALVGSHARGQARPDSDIDLVLLAAQPDHFVSDPEWVKGFGPVKSCAIEDWGRVTSVRVFYYDGREVEYALASPEWAGIPLDEGTQGVISGGMLILLDREGLLEQASKTALRG